VLPPNWSPPGHELNLMAKQNKKTKQKQGQQAQGRRSRRGRTSRGLSYPAWTMEKMKEYAHMLTNPCEAKLASGTYPGEVGVVSRFVADFSGVANSAGWLAYYPAVNAVGAITSVNSTTPQAFGWTVASPFSPGHGLLSTTANKSRGLAACLQVNFPNVSITNVTGEITVGCVSSDTFVSGGNYTVDSIFSVLTERTIVQRNQYECLFTPGSFDNRFNTYGTFGAVDQSDTNIVIIAWRGLPATTTPSFRITSVLEWTARPASGLAASASAPSPGIDPIKVASVVHQTHPNWWHNLKSDLISDASTVTRYVARSAMGVAGGLATGFIGQAARGLLAAV